MVPRVSLMAEAVGAERTRRAGLAQAISVTPVGSPCRRCVYQRGGCRVGIALKESGSARDGHAELMACRGADG